MLLIWVVADVRVVGRVAAVVAVVSFIAIGLHGRVARLLGKATVPISDDGLAWIGRTRCSPGEDEGGLDLTKRTRNTVTRNQTYR